jgi:hypothetical protein
MRQNAPRDAQLADKKIAYAILLARQSPAALPSGVRGWGSRSPLADFVLRTYRFNSLAGGNNTASNIRTI